MKPYQHHDPILDRGKATPHPKQPTHGTYRIRGLVGSWSRSEIAKAKSKIRMKEAKRSKVKTPSVHVGMFAAIAMLLGFKGRR